jgi:protein-S-isoprenylcysteine O-methyltransferase Ste14
MATPSEPAGRDVTAGRTRIPALGPRGEGWVAAQIVLFVVIAGLGLRDLSAAAPPLPLVLAGGVAIVLGGLVAVRATRDLGRNLSPFPRPLEDAVLVDSGVYAYVRHPIYSGLLLAGAGWSLATASIGAAAATVVLLLVLDAKSRREEVWLRGVYPGYDAYRAHTRRLVPGLY